MTKNNLLYQIFLKKSDLLPAKTYRHRPPSKEEIKNKNAAYKALSLKLDGEPFTVGRNAGPAWDSCKRERAQDMLRKMSEEEKAENRKKIPIKVIKENRKELFGCDYTTDYYKFCKPDEYNKPWTFEDQPFDYIPEFTHCYAGTWYYHAEGRTQEERHEHAKKFHEEVRKKEEAAGYCGAIVTYRGAFLYVDDGTYYALAPDKHKKGQSWCENGTINEEPEPDPNEPKFFPEGTRAPEYGLYRYLDIGRHEWGNTKKPSYAWTMFNAARHKPGNKLIYFPYACVGLVFGFVAFVIPVL